MVATQILLNNMAAALAQETYVVPGYLAVGTSTITPVLADTSLDGEIGDRKQIGSPNREDNEINYNVLRLGGDVVNTSTGDNLKSMSLFNIDTDGDMLTIRQLPGITQTTNFDLDIDLTIRFQ